MLDVALTPLIPGPHKSPTHCSGFDPTSPPVGLHYLAAVAAVALKLCHVTWRILTDQRDYVRERPPKT